MTIRPRSSEEVALAVCESSHVLAVGGNTKPALTMSHEGDFIDLSGLSGIVEYEPSEYVFSAKAGTPIEKVQATLREHGQYMPFDPPFADEGSTLGGMVASGLNGPGRLRFGGIRDFLIGVTFVDGRGRLIKGGGKVVKNAAGFDFPKFLVGSLGCFGILTEVSFKVFPEPRKFLTLRLSSGNLETGIEKVRCVAGSPLEPDGMELNSAGDVFLRIGGAESALPKRADRILLELGGLGEPIATEEADKFWRNANSFGWASPNAILAKVPVTPNRIIELDEFLSSFGATRRYGVACNVAWVAWPPGSAVTELDLGLRKRGLRGLVFRGQVEHVYLGEWTDGVITKAVKAAFDPDHKFPSIP
ncbi:MAG TPA: FAD-binding protein [Verrucomicrobiales bacterium]|nr:FAD-binding protein [Verrucomicrobiales bacterium]